jgi:hypothetical protein
MYLLIWPKKILDDFTPGRIYKRLKKIVTKSAIFVLPLLLWPKIAEIFQKNFWWFVLIHVAANTMLWRFVVKPNVLRS